MTTPRLILVQELGLAVAESSLTDAEWIDRCEAHLLRAYGQLQECKGVKVADVGVLALRAARGEG